MYYRSTIRQGTSAATKASTAVHVFEYCNRSYYICRLYSCRLTAVPHVQTVKDGKATHDTYGISATKLCVKCPVTLNNGFEAFNLTSPVNRNVLFLTLGR